MFFGLFIANSECEVIRSEDLSADACKCTDDNLVPSPPTKMIEMEMLRISASHIAQHAQ